MKYKIKYNKNARPTKLAIGELPARRWECSDSSGATGVAATLKDAYAAYRAARREMDASIY